jgi:hypothetical protein
MRTLKFIILVSIILGSKMAHALCSYPTPKICSAYFKSDVIFTGKVLSQKYVSDPAQENDNDWIEYRVQVINEHRGHASSITIVRTANASARWVGDVGKTYVFFLNRGEAYSTCGPLDEPEYVHNVVREIDTLKRASSSTIEGQVFSRSGPWGGGNGIPVVGAKLKAIGGGNEYVAVTDKEGKFSISVPPEKYKLNTSGMNPSDYSRQNVQEIKLEKGQCAQFELLKD